MDQDQPQATSDLSNEMLQPSTKFCPTCGSEIEQQVAICPKCARYQPGHEPAAPATPAGNTFSHIAIVLGVLSLVILPIIFGPMGIAMAAVGASKGESRWKIGMAVSIVLMLLSIAAGFYFAMQMVKA